MFKKFKNIYIHYFFLVVLIVWIKTYIIQVTQFNLGVTNNLQQFLLFINPLGSALIFLGLSFYSRTKGIKRYIRLILIDFLMTTLLYGNILYYRFFNDFLTIPTFFQVSNALDVSGSITSLLRPHDLLFFMDIVFLIGLLFFKDLRNSTTELKRKGKISILLIAFGISVFNLALAETDRPQLLSRGFDRNYIVKYLGVYNYTIYDAVQTAKTSTQRAKADSSDVSEITDFTNEHYAEPNPAYFGVAKGMNVLYLHLESIQTFLINYKLHDEEVTPFLNSLVNEDNTMYFDNFFHQTGQGKTADAEFMMDNSIYGLPTGAAFTIKGLNTYQALPAILKNYGYTSSVFHGNAGSFWNRNQIYKAFGYENFYDAKYYDMDKDELAEYGLNDKPFYAQSMEILKNSPQPFVTKMIPVTNHYPYKIKEEKTTIEKHTTGDLSVDQYFQTARYADEALKELFEKLKEEGLYDNTMIIMYGDHYGISKNHNRAMSEVLEKKVSSFENAELQRVPLFIRIPGIKGGINHTYGGQIDVLPTMLHLLGVETKNYVHFGTDLLSDKHDEVVAFRNGDFATPSVTKVNDKFYDTKTGDELDKEDLGEAKKYEFTVEKELDLSDKVVNRDLLRFHTPPGFKAEEK